jgi:uncharacterized protein
MFSAMISLLRMRGKRVASSSYAGLHGSEEVHFQSGDTALAGTLGEPSDARAAALILTGSGPLDRDSNGPHFQGQISPAIADAVADQRVASLRYDKRGVGGSGGNYYDTGMTDNYADASAAIDWLGARYPRIPVFAIGHSEGALHAAHLAADGKVAGAALVACAARRGEDILTWQAQQIVPTLPPATRAILRLLRIDPLASQRKAFARLRSTTANSLRIQGKKLNARWLRQFMDYDPRPVFEAIRVPVLVVIGDRDMQVPLSDARTIGELVAGPCEVRVLENVSHILRPDPESKGPRAYRSALRQPVSPTVLDEISGWVARQTSDAAPLIIADRHATE